MPTSRLQELTGREIRKRFERFGVLENTRPDWLISPQGGRLELDFYLEKLSTAIEVQGRQHFEFIPQFHSCPRDFFNQLRRDADKRQICLTAGVDLLYVVAQGDLPEVLYRIQKKIDGRLTTSMDGHFEQRIPYFLESRVAKVLPRKGDDKESFRRNKDKVCNLVANYTRDISPQKLPGLRNRLLRAMLQMQRHIQKPWFTLSNQELEILKIAKAALREPPSYK